MLDVFYKTLDSTDTANKYVSLDGIPLTADSVALDMIGGTAQYLNGDFAVDGTKVTWNGYALDGTMSIGDKVRVIYDRS